MRLYVHAVHGIVHELRSLYRLGDSSKELDWLVHSWWGRRLPGGIGCRMGSLTAAEMGDAQETQGGERMGLLKAAALGDARRPRVGNDWLAHSCWGRGMPRRPRAERGCVGVYSFPPMRIVLFPSGTGRGISGIVAGTKSSTERRKESGKKQTRNK